MTMNATSTAISGLEPTLPTRWYRSEEIFRLETERIFRREWVCVGREDELPELGSHRVIDVADESVIVVRNREGILRAFYNVCRHRGTRLCQSSGTESSSGGPEFRGGVTARRSIICPYHHWTYDLDGRLLSAPHLSNLTESQKSTLSLYPVRVECWGGFVFVNLTPRTSAPLLSQLDGIPARLQRYPLHELRIGHTIEYKVRANWKVICENYNECYHCGPVHPELCAVVPAFREGGGNSLDWLRGIPHRPGAYTFTASGTTSRRPFPGLDADERERHKGELVYPNLFVSLACDHVAAFILQPRSAELTDITCHFLFEPYELAKADFDPRDTVDFWDIVNRQDWGICEAVQQGMHSRAHEHGYYAPMEDATADIRRYILDRLGDVAL
jgi:Rieske 2Fe-2S family protein